MTNVVYVREQFKILQEAISLVEIQVVDFESSGNRAGPRFPNHSVKSEGFPR